jgi:hypothetical protein
MNVTSWQQAVRDLWGFIFPPVMTVLLLLLIAYLISGSRLFVPFKALAAHGFNLLQEEDSKKLIEFYGVSKLMPVIAAFSIVAVLYISMVAVRWVGNALPVSLTYNPDALFMSIDHSDRLARVWSKFPDVSTLSNLRTIIQERSYKAEKDLDKPFLGIASWESKAGSQAVSFDTVKFFVLWALLCLVISVAVGAPFWTALVRTIGICVILVAAGIYCGLQYFYATEQLAHAQLNAVDALVSSATQPGSNPRSEDDLDKYRKLVSAERDRQGRIGWWNVRIFDRYFYEWSYRTFIADERRSSNKHVKTDAP